MSAEPEKPKVDVSRETLAEKQTRALAVLERLEREYPNAKIALDFTSPLELLVATILAAQTRDTLVNSITRNLFPKYPTAKDWADAPIETLRAELKPTGFFNNKAKAVQESCRALVEKHGGQVPDSIEALTELPGVGRKTANVVLGNALGHPDRVAVDTHVRRLSQRLGLTKNDDPDEIEKDLEKLWPAERRTRSCHLLQFHGRRICTGPNPKCEACVAKDLCPSAFSLEKKKREKKPGKKRPAASSRKKE
ncbi:endonuclease III [bacterium]|nr:endonuclease III [bacterium]